MPRTPHHLNQAAPLHAGTTRSPSSSASCSRSWASRCCSEASASAGPWPPSDPTPPSTGYFRARAEQRGCRGAFRCFGQVDQHGDLEGDRPVALTWRLRQPLPELIFEATSLLATG